LPPGRIYSSGKAFIPPIKRDLVEKLVNVLNSPGDESQTFKLAYPPGQTPAMRATRRRADPNNLPDHLRLAPKLERHPTWACLLNI